VRLTIIISLLVCVKMTRHPAPWRLKTADFMTLTNRIACHSDVPVCDYKQHVKLLLIQADVYTKAFHCFPQHFTVFFDIK